jgi:hypothetical protein
MPHAGWIRHEVEHQMTARIDDQLRMEARNCDLDVRQRYAKEKTALRRNL